MKKQLWIVRLLRTHQYPLYSLVDLLEKFATTVGRAALVKSSLGINGNCPGLRKLAEVGLMDFLNIFLLSGLLYLIDLLQSVFLEFNTLINIILVFKILSLSPRLQSKAGGLREYNSYFQNDQNCLDVAQMHRQIFRVLYKQLNIGHIVFLVLVVFNEKRILFFGHICSFPSPGPFVLLFSSPVWIQQWRRLIFRALQEQLLQFHPICFTLLFPSQRKVTQIVQTISQEFPSGPDQSFEEN